MAMALEDWSREVADVLGPRCSSALSRKKAPEEESAGAINGESHIHFNLDDLCLIKERGSAAVYSKMFLVLFLIQLSNTGHISGSCYDDETRNTSSACSSCQLTILRTDLTGMNCSSRPWGKIP
jgi:hypothetical protein